MSVNRDLVDSLRAALYAAADPARAAGQQAYMKSSIPYWGLTAPVLRATVRPVLDDPGHRLDRGTWEATIRALWDEVTHREEWYAAIALARHRHYRGWIDSDAMPLWRHLIETGASGVGGAGEMSRWDVVDEVATHLVLLTLEREPQVEGLRMREWAEDGHLWVRRSAIICQVGRRERVDLDLLAATIVPNLADRDFFVRKAIGWALRDAARTHPDWVRAFVGSHEGALSGLSRREAMKHLG